MSVVDAIEMKSISALKSGKFSDISQSCIFKFLMEVQEKDAPIILYSSSLKSQNVFVQSHLGKVVKLNHINPTH